MKSFFRRTLSKQQQLAPQPPPKDGNNNVSEHFIHSTPNFVPVSHFVRNGHNPSFDSAMDCASPNWSNFYVPGNHLGENTGSSGNHSLTSGTSSHSPTKSNQDEENGFQQLDLSRDGFVYLEVIVARSFPIVTLTETTTFDVQVQVGAVNPGGPADKTGRLFPGDTLLAINGKSVVDSSHEAAIDLIEKSPEQLNLLVRGFRPKSLKASIRDCSGTLETRTEQTIRTMGDSPQNMLTITRANVAIHKHGSRSSMNGALVFFTKGQQQPDLIDVVLTRKKDEGFGFVIVSSLNSTHISEIGEFCF
ncbi:hypothetical protein Ciccas_010418 [Cichlidogyrus casuarinus]|uniref:PDZ domain-containing protein n=1 Tax=Cichlidogyrus casuarinus TaxID=1844966 RepID=A0ABD2PW67_9PLAT